ncbi:DNA-3-methyladenine glycosylase I [Staphylococcus simiae]|uniref:DNA-3-methyladenine glycosylase I n=1 Tax=Staphylococcus simiae TaxID=308354 RepID=UPI001A9608B8|nr:DNA-3-methyladenine glycosylase I [Staphylococcus simiae]MBO1198464.1 DNA-3-methyladenine glycosylase I [Staphylococcus simiae]MBO1201720.1 DNA-3-methyladenine glycosylase I [Staphylococcus simiae]MBO1203921.1 DNA-3-methyladenine glycosylase I [Staphylococcus simiae]MBO1210455.1 DNA-3-methyladenine glycosylase I [Staphylococcus simiae]MBO1230153.1 DNA-3-methyladenine glycosylase I [Staphylococcus simiae]
MNECAFGTTDPVYLDYHDHFWGQPLYDSKALFKLLALESQHAGLSWLTILKKKDSYEQAFYNFEPSKVATMTASDINQLMDFPNIVHHRKKLEAIVAQAQGYLAIEQQYGSFSDFLWSYVDGHPIDLNYKHANDRITVDERATQLSKDLKQFGFKFLGPVTVFSFLEAAGLYDAHLQDCPSKPQY